MNLDNPTVLGIVIAILAVAWVFLFYWTFKAPSPRLSALFSFLGMLIVTGILAYFFFVMVMKRDPDPIRIRIARFLTDNKMILLNDIVPGMAPADLDYVERIDTDQVPLDSPYEREEIAEEWFAKYRYDVRTIVDNGVVGPFGAAIYDYNNCRPPAILSYELVPVDYDYLGQDWIVASVANIIDYDDPRSEFRDLPEVIVTGYTFSAVTDLNIFRRQGVPIDCKQVQEWEDEHPDIPFPNPISYPNVGSFRANFRVALDTTSGEVTTMERSPFERSQIVIVKKYRPQDGTYFYQDRQELLPAVEAYLDFGTGRPDEVPEVYYPEKAVLAFYRLLGRNQEQLDLAESYLSEDGRNIHPIETDLYGLDIGPDSVVPGRAELARVLVEQIWYDPEVRDEQLHRTREVTVVVVAVNDQGQRSDPCQVTWTIEGVKNPRALPYGCEWRLETYWSTCVPGK